MDSRLFFRTVSQLHYIKTNYILDPRHHLPKKSFLIYFYISSSLNPVSKINPLEKSGKNKQ